MPNPNTADYLVNPNFKTSRGGSLSPTPEAFNDARIAAPATLRMLGKQSGSRNDQQQAPLMPPADIKQGKEQAVQRQNDASRPNGYNNSNTNGGAELRQFHRRSLGDWEFLETVGAGSMGKVKLVRHRQTKEVCVIKIVNRASKAYLHKQHSLPSPKNESETLERQKRLEKEIARDKRTVREASLGQILYHPHICRLFEMCTMSNHFYMLFEYVSGGQLLDYIIQHGSLKEHHARKFARGIASALQYLHANNIVHRDLKIENIMISSSGEIKIIDFGLSNIFDYRKQLHTFCGSLYFAAPELLKAQPYTGPEVDIWSFGIVLYVLVCGKVPFDDENSSILHEKIKKGKVDYPSHLSIEAISLLTRMIVVDPLRRATLKNVVEHPWMNRGYDFKAPSYVPNRVPLTPEMIDSQVLKEMYRLEFIDDIEDTRRSLIRLVTEREYIQLSQEYWDKLSNAKGLSSSLNNNYLNATAQQTLIQTQITNNQSQSGSNEPDNNFEDPTLAYHPLLSIYHLVSEMVARKLAKLQRRQALVLQAQTQQKQQQKQIPLGTKIALDNNSPDVMTKMRSPQKESVPKADIFQVPAIRTPGASKNFDSSSKPPLHVMVPPKLTIPEQAHTSPTSRKSSDIHTELNDVFKSSPGPVSGEYQQRSASPVVGEQQEKNTIGGIFRRISQSGQSQHPTRQQEPLSERQPPTYMLKPTENSIKVPKSHTRTISDYIPSARRYPTYVPNSIDVKQRNPVKNTTIAPPIRSASQKQSSELPALPQNAELIVQKQRQKQLQENLDKLQINDNDSNNNVNTVVDDMNNDNSDHYLSVPKSRKLHPSARAKSVGHARRESLKFTRPPIPAALPPSDMTNDNGFLGEANHDRYNPVSSNFSAVPEDSTTYSDNTIVSTNNGSLSAYSQELTEKQILEEASKAPPGSMPSIDYPKSMFLKGFFSVQTTSSKPLPIVRHNIISVLTRMNIDFKEVKGGFICVQQRPSVATAAIPVITTTGVDFDSGKTMDMQNSLDSQLSSSYHSTASTASRNGSIKRQGSYKRGQNNIPLTPLATNTHQRNSSIPMSPTYGNQSNGTSGELSSMSLEYVQQQDDILTTSRAQNINNINGQLEQNNAYSNKERPPIRFEIHIVKVRIVGLAGVHFKKVSGNTWLYKELASYILKELNL